MPDKTKITALGCFYNRHEYLSAFLDNIARQTLQPSEIVIVDDGSNPPLKVPERENLRVIRHTQNLGLAAARNTGIEAAKYELIALLDSDDSWRPDKLERQVLALTLADDDVMGVFTSYARHGRRIRGGVVHTPEVDDWARFFLLGIRSGPGSTLMFKRSCALDVGGFDVDLRRYEDWDWLLCASRKYRFMSLHEVLADVVLTGRPSADNCHNALDKIERRHMPQLKGATQRRLFRSALAFERAVVNRWEGKTMRGMIYGLQALVAPELVRREWQLTFGPGE